MARRSPPKSAPQPPEPARGSAAGASSSAFRWWREAIEAVAIALVLAFLIRSFEAEAFVIPTGSMAPTLYGRHKDLICPECGYQYQVGASEADDGSDDGDGQERFGRWGDVAATCCPMCLYPLELPLDELPGARQRLNNRDQAKKVPEPRLKFAEHRSFTGDRIIVDKLAYEMHEPQRWQVAVFKFPGSAKQNYIKRLIGLPGETVRIYQGDIYIRRPGEQTFSIARKPPRTQWYMLQPVHDTQYIPGPLVDAKFPARWFSDGQSGWTIAPDQAHFRLEATGRTWLRYRHLLPSLADWARTVRKQPVDATLPFSPELITDAYAYNSRRHRREPLDTLIERQRGDHWVGDLGLDTDLEIQSDTGLVLLDLVEGGRHFQCQIDVATGRATLRIDGGELKFLDESGQPTVAERSASTRIRGRGNHSIRFANTDDRLLVWIDNRLCEFDGPTEYNPGPQVTPRWSPQDAGDLYPVGVGGEGLSMNIGRLQVLRDIYYVATNNGNWMYDYDETRNRRGYPILATIRDTMAEPESWATTELFASRQPIEFELKRADDPMFDQFFMMGDNSPESSDGRLWRPFGEHFVERRLLIGRAVFVYWPHPWILSWGRFRAPVFPNFPRMELIH